MRKKRHPNICPTCEKIPCQCAGGGAADEEKSDLSKESAVEIMLFKPGFAISPDQRGVHENLWIKQRFKQYLSIGVYVDGSDLKYYFFENCDMKPKIYTSLLELKKELPSGLENIFENTPKLFIMGHGHGGMYGLCNVHGPSEEIYNANFDKILADFKKALSEQHDEIFVTLEACNTDNLALAAKEDQKKTFLERLSENHPKMTFCGTGPWDPKDAETGYRASGGFPILNAPITAMNGGIWKLGNSVIFYQGNDQIAVKKGIFASTETAKELKINTINYAREILCGAKEEMLTEISVNRDILNIEDLKKITHFPQEKFKDREITKFMEVENRIVEKEKNNYIVCVQKIFSRSESGVKFTERDLLIIALGIKHFSVFTGHEDLHDKILANEALLPLLMVTCGKVLIAGPSNDSLIDLLLKKGISINCVDEKGMTSLHYAVQNFYNYRKEPLKLITKLLDSGANLKAEDKEGRTPLWLAFEHSRKGIVIAAENLLGLLQERRLFEQSLLNPALTSGRNPNCFFQSFPLDSRRAPLSTNLDEHQHETFYL